MKSAAREDRGRLPRALAIYSGTPAGHTPTGTGGASCPATYNLAYPPFCPYPPVLVVLIPILRVVAASPPACPQNLLALRSFPGIRLSGHMSERRNVVMSKRLYIFVHHEKLELAKPRKKPTHRIASEFVNYHNTLVLKV